MVRRYRKHGLEAVQRKLLEGLTAAGVAGASVLEIGCGTGELQRRVLAAGAARTIGIDVADGMIDEARAAAEREGLQERATFLVGDAVERAAELPPAALVVLDKVLCCYPEIDTLLEVSLGTSPALVRGSGAAAALAGSRRVATRHRRVQAAAQLLPPLLPRLEPHRGGRRRRRFPAHLRRAHPGLGGMDIPPFRPQPAASRSPAIASSRAQLTSTGRRNRAVRRP